MIFLRLDVRILHEEDHLVFDGIAFSACGMVTLSDDCELSKIDALREALMVPRELFASLAESGKYLIFTSASGIADAGGHCGVDVMHHVDYIDWTFDVEHSPVAVRFGRQSYCAEIERVRHILSGLPPHIEIEPIHVFYPEEW